MIERYQDPELAEIWGLERTYVRWFEVELAHLREVAGASVADWLDEVGPPRPTEVRYQEGKTGHEMAAFLLALDLRMRRAEANGKDPEGQSFKARSALHFRLTSSDVIDTAMALALSESYSVVNIRCTTLENALLYFCTELKGKATLGRTHGQVATAMPANRRWLVLVEMLERSWARVTSAVEFLDVGKLSGPVGTSGGEVEVNTLTRLGLRDTEATQIVPRDRLAHFAYCLAGMATVCEAIATQVWLFAQQGIEELRVASNGSVGSSAMPHKNNPILAENVRGLARMARANAEALQFGIVQWGEHDLAHSSVERVALPDLLHLVVAALSRTATLVSGLSWEQPKTPEGYVDTHEELRQLQADGMPYVDAHGQLTELYRSGKITSTTTEEGP